MKIMPLVPLLLTLGSILGTACAPKATPAIEMATVNAEHASLRSRDSNTSRTLKGRWYRVRLGDTEGWMDTSTLLTTTMRKHIQENANSAKNQIPQNTGRLGQDSNLRVDPGRSTALLRRVPARTAVEVLERRTVPREDLPGRVDSWLKVRTSPTEVGWLLSGFVDFDVPAGIAPYTEDYTYSAVKILNAIEDPVAGNVSWYVVGERRPGTDPNLDFVCIRVFTWNARKQRYETAFRKQGLRGVYPLEVSRTAANSTFRVYELSADGKTKTERDFVMTGVIVRETKKK